MNIAHISFWLNENQMHKYRHSADASFLLFFFYCSIDAFSLFAILFGFFSICSDTCLNRFAVCFLCAPCLLVSLTFYRVMRYFVSTISIQISEIYKKNWKMWSDWSGNWIVYMPECIIKQRMWAIAHGPQFINDHVAQVNCACNGNLTKQKIE